MKLHICLGLGTLLTLGACKAEQSPTSIANEPAEVTQTAAPAPAPSGNAAKPQSSLPEPHGPIDPKSVEAAGQVVQSYGALIEQKRWKEANALWSDSASAAKFQSELSKNPEVHLEIGNLGESEGAAGSIYVTMPVIFYGDQADGQPFRRSADVILRRVNDVPGSTVEQRRWHIHQINWAA